ncbi:MAG: sulfatase-like hydrolase/transferase [Bacteroidales bacterium]|nr:sulfatase-like hydrolase/transferase [Bacteroidales bacterium]
MKRIQILLFCTLWALGLQASEKPNFLVLMFEDTSDDYLSAFGNTTIKTPNFDKLADEGILFTNAYSNGPQCSPARSTFIRGMYATTVGAEWHRMDVATPDDFFFPRLLQREGYKTYLSGKHDFNTSKDHWKNELKIFDGTDYTQCPADVPFYGQYNFFDTHMSRITDTRKDGQRDDRTVIADDVDSLDAYLPHTQWVMDDHAYHLHKIKLFDDWLKGQLDKLEATGRADNTIIFVTSDHGGCLPGSKGYIREAGVEVPLIAYFPPKWAHLAPVNTEGICSEIVEFADFGPTFFSLAALDKPAHMQGRAICGENREEPKEYAYLYKANQAPNFIPARGITDTQYKIIWNYNTVFPSGARQDFQWKMPGYRDWEAHWRNGEYTDMHSYFFEPMQTIEFYDLKNDPGETVNLANDPAYAILVQEYKDKLKGAVRQTKDLGFFPQSIRKTQFSSKAVYDYVTETGFDMEAVYEAAELASMAEAKDAARLMDLMNSPETVIRYWASVGMLRLRFHNKIEALPSLVNKLAHNEDENIEVRCINHCTLLCDAQFCEVVDFFRTNMTNDYCKGIIHNMGDRLRPIAAELYKGFKKQNFYTKSLLINAGIVPYEELIDHSNLTIDSAVIQASDTLDCQSVNTTELMEETTFYLPGTFYVGTGTFRPEFSRMPDKYSFQVFSVNGQRLFASRNPEHGWAGDPNEPLCIWELKYRLPGQKPQRTSGKVMVFVD